MLVNPQVGLLFLDFSDGTRLRLNGVASVDGNDPLLAAYPGAQMVVRVRAEAVFANCRRYVHHYELVEPSAFVPSHDGAPVPDWTLDPFFEGTLPDLDPARDPAHPSAPSVPKF
jgi:hypothetical protein